MEIVAAEVAVLFRVSEPDKICPLQYMTFLVHITLKGCFFKKWNCTRPDYESALNCIGIVKVLPMSVELRQYCPN